MCRIANCNIQPKDSEIIDLKDLTISDNDNTKTILDEDFLIQKMIKNKKNLIKLSCFLEQLETDYKFILKEELKEKEIAKEKINKIKSAFKTLEVNQSTCENISKDLLKEIECDSMATLTKNFYYYEDLFEEKSTEVMILKEDIRRVKLDRMKLDYIIQNGIQSNDDVYLLKRYNFISFCQ